MLLALLSLPANANAIRMAAVYHDDQPHGQVESRDPSLHVVSWPFCPSYGKSCSELAWVEVGVSVDAYVARRNGPHATASELTQTSVVDMQPMARALEDFFREQGITSDAVKVGYAHGLVQSLDYHLDSETGWTEYPKYAIESLVDEQGDCDDGAIWTASLLTIVLSLVLTDLKHSFSVVSVQNGPKLNRRYSSLAFDAGVLTCHSEPL